MSKFNIKLTGGVRSGLTTALYAVARTHLNHVNCKQVLIIDIENPISECVSMLSPNSRTLAIQNISPADVDKVDHLIDEGALVIMDVGLSASVVAAMVELSKVRNFTLIYAVTER